MRPTSALLAAIVLATSNVGAAVVDFDGLWNGQFSGFPLANLPMINVTPSIVGTSGLPEIDGFAFQGIPSSGFDFFAAARPNLANIPNFNSSLGNTLVAPSGDSAFFMGAANSNFGVLIKSLGGDFNLQSFSAAPYLSNDQLLPQDVATPIIVNVEGLLDGISQGVQSYNLTALGITEFTTFSFSLGPIDSFKLYTTTTNQSFLVDNIVTSVVPIPAAVWLFGSSLGLMGVALRKTSRG